MTRPEDIPEDVWAESRAVHLAWLECDGPIVIARAILAERARAAAICDDEIALAHQFGVHHVPILLSVKRAILGTTNAN